MTTRYPGGFITKSPVAPTGSAASGVWTMDQATQNIKAGTWPGVAVTRFSSRSTSITEGASSDYTTSTSNSTASWNYNGSNTDAITITTSGVSAKLQGWTIGNNSGGTNSFTFRLAIISGSATNGTILKQETFTARALSTGGGFTMVTFSDGGLLLTPGTYTLCFIWDVSQSGAQTRYQSGGFKTTSSISGVAGTLGISYGDATFNGAAALGATNGTSGTGNGQINALQWLF